MRRAPGVDARLHGLRAAVDVLTELEGDAAVAAPALEAAREVLTNAGRRRELSAEHTAVALAGTTGSGKSSLLNALSGIDAAIVGARRPTTSHPLALTWSAPDLPAAGAEPLLDWLEVQRRHEVPRSAAAWDGTDVAGLVLLDLPDIDSVDADHRRRAERLAKTVDVLVWVLDPQKYADAVVHADFLRPMAQHAAVTVVVLNQIDRLAAADRPAVLGDLAERLAEDGLRGVSVLGVSARTGEGLTALRTAVTELVRRRRASDARLAADVATAAAALDEACHADRLPELPAAAVREVVASLSVAAGVDRVAEAVGRSHRMRARARTGWPLVRWVGRFRADPLRRLHLDRAPAASAADAPVLTASSVPAASPVQRAQAQTALRTLGAAAAAGSEEPWRSHVRAGATERAEELSDALDQAVVRTAPVAARDPRWFRVVGALQWVVFVAFAAGALWLTGYAVLGYLRIEVGWVPQVGPVPADPPLPALPGIPWPTVLLAGGAALGVLTALLSAGCARLGARRRAARTRAALRREVATTVERMVLAPLQRRAARARAFAEGIALARGQ